MSVIIKSKIIVRCLKILLLCCKVTTNTNLKNIVGSFSFSFLVSKTGIIIIPDIHISNSDRPRS